MKNLWKCRETMIIQQEIYYYYYHYQNNYELLGIDYQNKQIQLFLKKLIL